MCTWLIPASNGLQILKRKGEWSMPGKGVKGQSYLAPLHQHKTCMAKATLLEPQSQRPKNRRHGRRVAEKPVRDIERIRPSSVEPYYPGVLPMREVKGTNVAPNHVVSPHDVNAGSPKLAGQKDPPVRRRSSHSTQGWPVMGSAAGQWSRTDTEHKWKATAHENSDVWGKGNSLISHRGNESEDMRMLSDRVSRKLMALEDASKKGRKVKDLFRLMGNPELWMTAYANIHANKGANTPGISTNTMDGFSEDRVLNLIELLKEERYQPSPVRRIHIPKDNGKRRPLGLPMCPAYCTSYQWALGMAVASL